MKKQTDVKRLGKHDWASSGFGAPSNRWSDYLPTPACQEEHRPEHWKHGQSPRAHRLVVFRDGHREYLCKRCLTDAYRTARGDLVDQIDHTEAIR